MPLFKKTVGGIIAQGRESSSKKLIPAKYNGQAGYRQISFACCNFDSKKNFVEVYGPATCRDGMCSMYHTGINSTNKNSWPPPLSTDKLHLAVHFFLLGKEGKVQKGEEDLVLGQMERAVRIFDILETFAGWPKSRIYPIKLSKENGDTSIVRSFYCHASRRWVKAPPMVSMYALIIRTAKDKIWDGAKNIDDLVKIGTSGNLKQDNHYVYRSASYWKRILSGYPELFRKKKITHYWGHLNYACGIDGIGHGNAPSDTAQVFKNIR